MRSLLSIAIWAALVAVLIDVGAAVSQQANRIYKVGWLTIGRPGIAAPPAEKWTLEWGAFRDFLRSSGFVLGRNLIIESRHADGDRSRLPAQAEALVSSGVDVIVTSGTPPTVAAMQATNRVPIVFWGLGDPVEKGVVSSLARPGGNVTGMAVMIAMPKQWQLLHEFAPTVRRAGFMGNAANTPAFEQAAAFEVFQVARMKAGAASVGIEPLRMRVNTLADVEGHYAELARLGSAGVVVVNDALLVSPEWRGPMMEMAIKYGLPTSCAQSPPWAQAGCLVTYAENWDAILRGAAAIVVKILKGSAPASIPVEQPTEYRLLVNIKTAKALGLAVPPALLVAADEVIE